MPCEQCGGDIQPRSYPGGKPQRYCSDRCSSKARGARKTRHWHSTPVGRTKWAAYMRSRRSSDLNFKLAASLRERLGKALTQKNGSAVRDLGCTVEELRKHLESKFQPGMTWGNWSRAGWHIDHVRPLASFDLTDRSQFLQACHYTNLQPLWATENLSKGASYADP